MADEPTASTSVDAVYRERAQLVAYLATRWPAVLHRPNGPNDEWPVVYIESPAGQLSWHLSPAELDLFESVPWLADDAASPWDGHTTAQKYARLADCGRLPT